MKSTSLSVPLSILLSLTAADGLAAAADACDGRAITAAARVQVSDGTTFETKSYFQAADVAAIEHSYPGGETQLIAVEGPVAWARRGDRARLGGDDYRNFALGHQFHALLLFFDTLVSSGAERGDIPFGGAVRAGSGGDLPFGGRVYLVKDSAGDDPAGFLFELPDSPPMEVHFRDWRDAGGTRLPFNVEVDDGSRRFDYFFQDIGVAESSPAWFFEAVPAPDLDALQVQRLHRRLLAAHCLGDADMIAGLTAPEIIVSSRGELHRSTREETRESFTRTFERLEYREYHDLVEPVIEISQAGDLAWIAVSVRAVGVENGSGAEFDSQWSWIMLAKKIDGAWLHAGNASNRLQ